MSDKGRISQRHSGGVGTVRRSTSAPQLAPWPVTGPEQQLVDVEQVLQLQRLVGNRAVAISVQRQTGTAVAEDTTPLLNVPELIRERVNQQPEISEAPIEQAERGAQEGREDGQAMEQLGVSPSRPAFSEFFASMAGAAGGAFASVVSGAKRVGGAIASGASWLGGKIASGARTAGSAIASGARSAWGGIKSGASWLGGEIASGARTAGSAIASGARSAWGGIKSGASWLWGKMQGVAGMARDTLMKGSRETEEGPQTGDQAQMDEHLAGKLTTTRAGLAQTATAKANTGVGALAHIPSIGAKAASVISTVTGAIGIFFSSIQAALDLRALVSATRQKLNFDTMAKEAKEKAVAEGHTEEEANEIVETVRYAMEQKYSKLVKRALAFSGGILSIVGAGGLLAVTLASNPIGWGILAGIGALGALLGIGLLAYKIYRWYQKKYKTEDLGKKRLEMASKIVSKLKGGDELARRVVTELHLEPVYITGLDEAVAIDKVMEKLRSS